MDGDSQDVGAEGIIEIRQWKAGHAPELLDPGRARETIANDEGAVICIDISSDADGDGLHASLERICGESLTPEMVRDLLEVDPLPKVLSYSDGRVRSVSGIAVRLVNPDRNEPTRCKAGRLIFDTAEMLAGPNWLITCCHTTTTPAKRSREHDTAGAEGATRGCHEVFRQVERRWQNGDFSTVGDLGVLILHELTCSYAGARKALYNWMDDWEVAFFRDGRGERQTITDLRTLIGEFRRRLNAMDVPDDEACTGWFAGVTNSAIATRADRHINHSIADLNELGQSLRTTMDLVQMSLVQQSQDASEKLTRKVEIITSVFVVPTLIAGIFGANTALPGGNDPRAWASFEYMLIAMIVGASAVYLGLVLLRRHDSHQART